MTHRRRSLFASIASIALFVACGGDTLVTPPVDTTHVVPPPPPIDVNRVMEKAQDAFWEVVVEGFPSAKSGDLSPERSSVLDDAARAAIEEWVNNNVPRPQSGGVA